MIPNDTAYSFLDCIYEDSETKQDRLYEVVFSTSTYKTQFVRVSLPQLKEIYEECQQRKIVTDFRFEQEYLMCNSQVRRFVYTDLLELEDTRTSDSTDTCDFYQFVRIAAEDGYLMLCDDQLLKEDVVITSRVCHFYTLQYSKSTMSAYFRVASDGQTFNKLLAFMDGGVLSIAPFYYAVPKGKTNCLSFTTHEKSMQINNEEYEVYFTDFVSLYAENHRISASLLNKAVNSCLQNELFLKMINTILDGCYSGLGCAPSRLEWVGGTESRESPYGVWLDGNAGKVSKAQFSRLYACLMYDVIPACKTKEELTKMVASMHRPKYEKLALLYGATAILSGAGDLGETIVSCNQVKLSVQKNYFYAGLYAYQARVTMFFDKTKQLVLPSNPVLYGSDEPYYTIVRGGLYYGE